MQTRVWDGSPSQLPPPLYCTAFLSSMQLQSARGRRLIFLSSSARLPSRSPARYINYDYHLEALRGWLIIPQHIVALPSVSFFWRTNTPVCNECVHTRCGDIRLYCIVIFDHQHSAFMFVDNMAIGVPRRFERHDKIVVSARLISNEPQTFWITVLRFAINHRLSNICGLSWSICVISDVPSMTRVLTRYPWIWSENLNVEKRDVLLQKERMLEKNRFWLPFSAEWVRKSDTDNAINNVYSMIMHGCLLRYFIDWPATEKAPAHAVRW